MFTFFYVHEHFDSFCKNGLDKIKIISLSQSIYSYMFTFSFSIPRCHELNLQDLLENLGLFFNFQQCIFLVKEFQVLGEFVRNNVQLGRIS